MNAADEADLVEVARETETDEIELEEDYDRDYCA